MANAKASSKKVAAPATKKTSSKAVAAKPVAKSATKVVAKPATKVTAKPAAKAAAKPVVKPAAKPATKVATKPVAQSTTKVASAPKVTAKKSVASSSDVLFQVYSPDSQSVAVAGDFNSWNPTKGAMKKGKDGVWTLKTKLTAGSYQYKLVYDNQYWETDNSNPNRVADGQGGENSIKHV